MTEETTTPPATAEECLAAARTGLASEFRAELHALKPHVVLKLRTLDNDTYLKVPAELRQHHGDALAAALKPLVDDIVAHLKPLIGSPTVHRDAAA